ncbi:MAG: NAD(P)/FAD-dependent oxidoreductase [Spirochaetes bacterium]|nr:NAD(P)/FAD-dependent oxidoreductase [Spirochaetota bacterium]
MKLLIEDITLNPDQSEDLIPFILKKNYNINADEICIARKSLDARDKGNIVYRYRVIADVRDDQAGSLLKKNNLSVYEEPEEPVIKKRNSSEPVIIVGAGPAGLFCALRLIESGINVIVLERGQPVEERVKDIALLEKQGVLNTESNVLFGEGGAGTYSDGKLTARTKRPESRWFFGELIRHGADESVSYEAKPHVGTDRLGQIIRNIRNTIAQNGSQIVFNEKAVEFITERAAVKGVRTESGKEYAGRAVVLATGHSAGDVFKMLNSNDIALEKKGFAAGVRIEHPSGLINGIQYGNSKFKNSLPPAEYVLTFSNKKTGRGVYSFCMCPGGQVVNASSEENLLCVNGMSNSKRDSPFSNSALVVTVNPDDFPGDVLSGIEFRRNIEEKAFSAGGGGFVSPAQRVTSFLQGKVDAGLPESSYLPQVKANSIAAYLPAWITDELKQALQVFDRRMKGFLSEDALLIGAETRTSSPVRILRRKDFQSVSIDRLYPAGEGAGYAGGIVSSAVDGIRIADSILENI